uniref:PLAC domain-containing protein n=1 Tax=Poecilia latipinna TaxID=48699 RepID=A0A3B3U9Z7_9TELE
MFLVLCAGTSALLSLQCSQTCGGGVQKRQVFCKQRLADGSILELPDTFCPSRAPDNQRPCGRQDCPPQWVTADWSQCSVTCGNGIQTLQAVCRKQGENGQYSIVNSINCSMIARPIRIRSCFLRHCEVDTWAPCSASCGGGSQTRRVRCMMGPEGSLREVQTRHCLGKGKKPSSSRLCNILPSEECRDSTRYCERVRQLELCPLQQFKSRCCHSCRKT